MATLTLQHVHKISYLLQTDDAALRKEGRDELAAALAAAGGVHQAARVLGQSARTIFRWIKRAGLTPPDGRAKAVSNEQIRKALRRRKSALGAAKELGVSHTMVANRARKAGMALPDGRKRK
jgi:transcriptional regulator with GAF, ATPase, and Fis domain